MNSFALFLAVVLATTTVRGQQPASSAAGETPILLAQNSSSSTAEPTTPDDTMTIKARPQGSAGAPEESAPMSAVNLWNLVKSGGWAMIPLGFLSVMTVMLVLAYLITLRRSSILTPNYMNTADVLLKSGIISASSRSRAGIAKLSRASCSGRSISRQRIPPPPSRR
jgi:hypothetical protein